MFFVHVILMCLLEKIHNRCILLAFLLRVVKDDPHRVSLPRTQLADAVAHVNPIDSTGSLHGTGVNCERYSIALLERYNLYARLHTWTLFGQHKLAAGKIVVRRGEQDGDLNRENMLSVEILMKAVVIAFAVLEEQRRRPMLSCVMAALNEFSVSFGIAHVDVHCRIPAVGYRREMRIQRSTKFLNDLWQRIAEIFVLAAPEAMPSHDNAAAKEAVVEV